MDEVIVEDKENMYFFLTKKGIWMGGEKESCMVKIGPGCVGHDSTI